MVFRVVGIVELELKGRCGADGVEMLVCYELKLRGWWGAVEIVGAP